MFFLPSIVLTSIVAVFETNRFFTFYSKKVREFRFFPILLFTMTGHEGHGLASISLTHVYFNPQDKISYAFAYITLAPIAILVFYASVIVSRREMASILMLAGQLLNEALNYILKESIEQDRPYSKYKIDSEKKEGRGVVHLLK